MISSVAFLHPAGVLTLVCAVVACAAQNDSGRAPRLRAEPRHPWTPPFGLDRVGRPLEAVVELPDGPTPGCTSPGGQPRAQNGYITR